jgi:hypothetical protein
VSVQLQALADEVFDAVAGQARVSAQAIRRPFGEVIRNPDYPDLATVNMIQDLVAPDWTADDVLAALSRELPGASRIQVTSRDRRTIDALDPRLRAWLASGCRYGMLLTRPTEARPRPGRAPAPHVVRVEGPDRWTAFDSFLGELASRHNWSRARLRQLLALIRWRAANTPHRYYLVCKGDDVSGCLGLFQHGSTAYLHNPFGWTAMSAAVQDVLTLGVIEEAAALGCNRVVTECSKEDRHSWWRLGFRVLGEQQIWTSPPPV